MSLADADGVRARVGLPTRDDELAHAEPNFQAALECLLNRHCIESGSNTPDFLLASYLIDCLHAWNRAVLARDIWDGKRQRV